LCPTSSIYRTIKEAKQNDDMAQFPPLYMFHGYDDEMVKFTWAEQTANSFIDLDNEIQFDYCYGLNHDITVLQLIKLKDWILKKLPYKTKKERKEEEERKVIKNDKL
jgi:predicted esterase